MEWDEVARGSFIRKLNPQDVEACLVSGGLEKIRYSAIGSFLSQHSPSLPAAHRLCTPRPPKPALLRWPKEKAPGSVKAGSCEIPKAPAGSGDWLGRGSRLEGLQGKKP